MTEGAGAAHFGPGEKAPRSGLYRATSAEKADVALSEGDRFPPLEQPGARWILYQATERPAEQTIELHADPSRAIEQLTAAAYHAALNELIRAARTSATTPELPTGPHLRAQRDLRHAVAAFDRLTEGYDVETSVTIEEAQEAGREFEEQLEAVNRTMETPPAELEEAADGIRALADEPAKPRGFLDRALRRGGDEE